MRQFRQADRIEKLFVTGRWYDCISEYNKAIEAGTGDFFVQYYLGLSNFQLGFIDESTKNLTDAINLSGSKTGKNKDGAYLNLAKYKIAANHCKLRQYDLAIDQLNQNITDDPKYIEHYQLKASI
jgi:tetratricopeptide (TPR) repeat protein